MKPPSPRRRSRRLLLGAGLAVALPGAAGILGFVPQDAITRRFFVPFTERGPEPDPAVEPHELLWLEAEDGSAMEAWLFAARTPEPASGLVLHAHGNAGNLSRHWMLASGLADHGFEVLTFDYRGFGRSGGRTSRRAARQDLRVALAEARRRAGSRPVFVLGQSMGASLALEVLSDPAARTGVEALVADSPFDSWAGIAALHLSGGGGLRRPVEWMFAALLRRSGEEPLEAAGRLGGLPLLVVAGTGDRICPPDMARAVHSAAGASARLLELPDQLHVGLRGEEERTRVLAATAAFFHDGPSRRRETAPTRGP